jgi:hypothetical protein
MFPDIAGFDWFDILVQIGNSSTIGVNNVDTTVGVAVVCGVWEVAQLVVSKVTAKNTKGEILSHLPVIGASYCGASTS